MTHDMEPIGMLLRQERESRQMTLQEAANKTRIRLKYLEMIENDKFDTLPPKVYTECYLRHYSQFLGLDGNHLVRIFRRLYPKFATRATIAAPVITSRIPMPNSGKSLWWWALLSCSTSVICYGVWHHLDETAIPPWDGMKSSFASLLDSSEHHEMRSIPSSHGAATDCEHANLTHSHPYDAPKEVPATVQSSAVLSDNTRGPVASGNMAASTVDDSKIVLLSKGDGWVKLFDEKRSLIREQYVHAGDTVFVPNSKGIHLATDHPELLEVYRNGELSALVAMQPSSDRPYLTYYVSS